MKAQPPARRAREHTVEHQRVDVDVEIDGTAEALKHRDTPPRALSTSCARAHPRRWRSMAVRATLRHRSCRQASWYRSRCGTDRGPRFLQENATSRSVVQPLHRNRAKPPAKKAQRRNARNSSSTNRGSVASARKRSTCSRITACTAEARGSRGAYSKAGTRPSVPTTCHSVSGPRMLGSAPIGRRDTQMLRTREREPVARNRKSVPTRARPPQLSPGVWCPDLPSGHATDSRAAETRRDHSHRSGADSGFSNRCVPVSLFRFASKLASMLERSLMSRSRSRQASTAVEGQRRRDQAMRPRATHRTRSPARRCDENRDLTGTISGTVARILTGKIRSHDTQVVVRQWFRRAEGWPSG